MFYLEGIHFSHQTGGDHMAVWGDFCPPQAYKYTQTLLSTPDSSCI